jgi:formylglycine-generating enzyme required for sulfatase activity/predicted Rossmann-fold nucleotide-binding protein
MIDGAGRLLAALQTAGVIENPTELADALWLAQWMLADAPQAPEPKPGTPEELPPSLTPTPIEFASKTPNTPDTPAPVAAPTPGRLSVHLPRLGQGSAAGAGRGIVAPSARALPDGRTILRALRPLMQKVAVRGRWEVDEEKTVRRVVEERIWLPVVRPMRERWLRLSLLVDGGVSMGVWRATIRELYRLLQGCGTFLQVRLWSLELAHDPPRLHSGLTIKPGQAGHDVRELHDPSGRSLLLLLSDAVGPEWYSARTSALLADWARRMPVALVQMLPENLWPRTALAVRNEVYVHPTGEAVPSARLRVERESDWLSEEQPSGVPLPLLVLEPAAVSAWARMVAGRNDARLPGVLLDPGTEGERSVELAIRDMQADERIQRFKQTASRSAWKLAGLLAAAPVLSLPILRLVRQEMLPEARQVHEAEVLLGGLLALRGERASDPDEEQYEFHVGVRERLLDSVPLGQTLSVLERVADYVEKHLGMGFGFRALLRDPAASTGTFVPDDTSFAQIAAGVLERLGGHYARIVRPEAVEVSAPVPVVKPAVPESVGPAHWIWVAGTRTEPSDLERLAATQVARILVEEGYGLIVSGSTGLMQLVAHLFVDFQETEVKNPPPTQGPMLLIQVERDRFAAETYRLQARLISTQEHFLRYGNKPVSRQGLREEVRDLCAELALSNFPKGHLTIEFLVPSEIVALDPASWPVAGDLFGEVPLGTKCHVVVRALAPRLAHSEVGKLVWLRHVLNRGEEPGVSGAEVQFVGSSEEKLTECACQASAVIVIGGVHGPIAVAKAAQAESKPVLPWAVTGGAAAEIHKRVVAEWAQKPIASLSRADFERLADRLTDGSVVRHILRRLLNPANAPASWPPSDDTEPSLWVLVLGTKSPQLSPLVVETSDRIARLLTEEGYGLITCGHLGVEQIVTRAFVEIMQVRGAMPVQRALRYVRAQDEPRQFDLGDNIPVRSEWEQESMSLHLADAVILIGDRFGSERAVQAAMNGMLVLPLPQSGAGVKAVFQQLIDDWSVHPSPVPPLEAFKKLDRDLQTITEAVRPLLRWLVEKKGEKKDISPPELPAPGLSTCKPRAWVLVAGTGSERLSQPLSPVCRLVARILAEEDFGLITGGWVGVDTRVSLEFAHALSEQKGPPLEDFLCQVMYEDQPPQHELGRTIRVQGETEWQQTVIEKADAVVIIGGLGMTQDVAWMAVHEGKPVLPLAQTGGDARALFDEVRRNWENSSFPILTKADFEHLETVSEDGRELRRLLNLVVPPKTEQPPAPAQQMAEPTIWVSVAGTATRDLPGDQLEASRIVGRILAEDGYGLLTGGCAGVDSAVARAFTETLDRFAGTLLHLRQVLTEAQTLEHDLGEIIRVPTEKEQHETALEMASAFITIGDVGSASEKTDERARQTGKTVLPLASTGGGARDYHALILDTWENCPVRPLTFHEFQELALPLGDGSRLRRLLRQALLPSETTVRFEPKMWVLVAGSSQESLPQPLTQACERVGRLLAVEGYGLITGGSVGVDTLVGQAFVTAVRERGVVELRGLFHQFLVRGQMRLLDEGESEVLLAEHFESQITKRAGAVILLAGSHGTRLIAEAALRAGKPVLPLASTGAYAQMLHRAGLDRWDDQKIDPLSREEFARLANPPGADLVQLLRLVLERHHAAQPEQPLRNGPEIFLSWSTADKASAQEITDLLTSAGVSVWFGMEQTSTATTRFEETVRAMKGCKIVLVICSDAAIQSSTVRQEVTLASREGKVVLPLIVSEPRNVADLAYFLGHLQPLRIVGRPASEWLPELLAALERTGVKHHPTREDSGHPRQDGPLNLGDGVRMDFSWVPPGTLWMGGGGGKPGDKQVTIEQGFGLGIYPVTQEQWQAVMASNPSHFSRTGGGKAKVEEIADEDLRLFPVEQVSWDDVTQFLAKLNEREKGSGWFYRLPSEAEWEYACRGGATSREDCSFHFYFDNPTNDLSSEQANFNGNSPEGAAGPGPNLERTSRVGSYRPNRLGLYDMHGNVWEWCGDWIDRWLDRVIRGGCWCRDGADCRATSRGGSAPSNRDFDLGFRVARVVR